MFRRYSHALRSPASAFRSMFYFCAKLPNYNLNIANEYPLEWSVHSHSAFEIIIDAINAEISRKCAGCRIYIIQFDWFVAFAGECDYIAFIHICRVSIISLLFSHSHSKHRWIQRIFNRYSNLREIKWNAAPNEAALQISEYHFVVCPCSRFVHFIY